MPEPRNARRLPFPCYSLFLISEAWKSGENYFLIFHPFYTLACCSTCLSSTGGCEKMIPRAALGTSCSSRGSEMTPTFSTTRISQPDSHTLRIKKGYFCCKGRQRGEWQNHWIEKTLNVCRPIEGHLCLHALCFAVKNTAWLIFTTA